MGQMSDQMGDTETGKFCIPIATGGGVDDLHELVPADKHPSGPVLSSSPPNSIAVSIH